MFTGIVGDIAVDTMVENRVATLEAVGKTAYLRERKIDLGIMPNKKADIVLRRVRDKLESGEQVTNDGGEAMGQRTNGSTTGYTALNSATLQSDPIHPVTGDPSECDFAMRANPSAGSALSGWKYDLTGQVAAGAKERAAVWARRVSTNVAVRFRLRQTVSGVDSDVATTTVTLTAAWQYIELEGTFSASSTARWVELVTDVASSNSFYSDGLHAVLSKNKIEADFEAGVNDLSWVTWFREEGGAGALLQGVASSEPGQLYEAATGKLTFRNKNSRSTSRVPRITLGDGDGHLPYHKTNLKYLARVADRVTEVTVTSRGAPILDANNEIPWSLQPTPQTFATGDEIYVRHNGICVLPDIIYTSGGGGAPDINGGSRNYGSGSKIRIATGSEFQAMKQTATGVSYRYPSEDSQVVKRVATAHSVERHLSVAMPFQGTRTAAMTAEADRLIAKYDGRVMRLSIPLKQYNEEIEAWQAGLELNDKITVRSNAKTADGRSLGIDKEFYVEGIEHTLGKGNVLETVLLVEEA
jgi:hypothetical protein